MPMAAYSKIPQLAGWPATNAHATKNTRASQAKIIKTTDAHHATLRSACGEEISMFFINASAPNNESTAVLRPNIVFSFHHRTSYLCCQSGSYDEIRTIAGVENYRRAGSRSGWVDSQSQGTAQGAVPRGVPVQASGGAHRGNVLGLDLSAAQLGEFLSHLATANQVAASTQNQALNALLFLRFWTAPRRLIATLESSLWFLHELRPARSSPNRFLAGCAASLAAN